ncbi:TPA: prepilin peptidase [Candidatus Micrarchaeota archaeon]|nr:prepilin peptidase [Candidatus Micrarchaeota archaeon]
MMNFELVRIAIAVALTGVAAYEDAKTSYVSDRVLYAMIAAGLLLDVAAGLGFFLSVLPFALVIALGGFILWKRGSFGQGDVWLFLGLQLLLPSYPSFAQTSLPGFPFTASVFLASSFFSTIGAGAFYASGLFKVKNFFERSKVKLVALVAVVFAVSWFVSMLSLGVLAKAFFVLFSACALFFAFFFTEIKEKLLVKFVPLSQVDDEDVLVVELMPETLLKQYSLGRVVTKNEFEKLKKIVKGGRMKRFPILKNLIRFNPYVLLGLLACLYAGDLLLWLLFQ